MAFYMYHHLSCIIDEGLSSYDGVDPINTVLRLTEKPLHPSFFSMYVNEIGTDIHLFISTQPLSH